MQTHGKRLVMSVASDKRRVLTLSSGDGLQLISTLTAPGPCRLIVAGGVRLARSRVQLVFSGAGSPFLAWMCLDEA